MKKPVSSSNLALRFYKTDGWTLECLNKYLISGEFYDTQFTHHQDPPESAYYIMKPGTKINIAQLYAEEVSTVYRAFDDYPYQSDLQFMESHGW